MVQAIKGRRSNPLRSTCITSNEKTVCSVLARIARWKDCCHEVRLDFLRDLPEDLGVLRPGLAAVILCCRPLREGGGFKGTEKQRVEILARAIEARPMFVDIELGTSLARFDRLSRLADNKTKIILSSHHFSGMPRDIYALVDRMNARPADVRKLAVTIRDPSDLLRVAFFARLIKKPKVIIAMGTAGMLTRIVPERFGSMFTYVTPDCSLSTAAGQLTVDELLRYRKSRGRRPALLGIVGNSAVLDSLGLRVYNHLFSRRGGPDALYAPVVTSSFKKTILILKLLGFKGVSVTQPHKRRAFLLCDRLSQDAAKIEAVNTLVFSQEKIHGYNTDVLAARTIFDKIPVKKGENLRVALVGAGGAAAAVAAALAERGWTCHVYNRTPGRGRKLAAKYGMKTLPLKNLEKGGPGFDMLINCTSVGMDSNACIVRSGRILKGKIVMDLVSHPAETELLRKAKRAGGLPISGTHFWSIQGREQMKLLISRTFRLKTIENIVKKYEY